MRPIFVALAIVAVSIGACGKKEETAATTVTTSDGGVTVTTRQDGVVTTQSVEPTPHAAVAPPDTPAVTVKTPDYAPLYPGAVVKASSNTATNGHQVGTVTYKTSAAPQAVIDFYKPKAAGAGFAVSDANIGVGLMLAGTDTAKQRTLQVIATAEKTGTAVVLSWTSQTP